MIRLLGEPDRPWLEGISGLSWNLLQIQCLLRAYGFGYDFLRFYGDLERETVLSVLNGSASLWAGDAASWEELAEFLPFAAHTVVAERPLRLEGWRHTQGKGYILCAPPARRAAADSSLEEAFRILSQVFTESIHPGTYAQWYTELSHRVRHGISRVYTLEGACAGIAYGLWDGWLGITQLAVLRERRGQGLARRLLAHMAAELQPEKGLLLLSQDEHSNQFYEHLGFLPYTEWHCCQL